MTTLTRPLHNSIRAARMPLAFVFARVTKESFIKVTVVIIAAMVLLQLTTSSLVRHSKDHRSPGLLGLWNERTNSLDDHKASMRSQHSIRSASSMDQDIISALPKNSSIFSVITSSRTESENQTFKSNKYFKWKVSEGRDENPNESHLSQKQNYSSKVTPSVIANIYPRPRKHKTRQKKIRNILDLSTNEKQNLIDSNEVSYSEKLMTYKKNLTALLHEIKLPATTPEYDIVSPGASAEDRGTPDRPKGKPLCPAVPKNLEGPLYVTFAMPTMSKIEAKFPDVIDGRWSPKNCTARHRVAIIIPYRDREEHLRIYLNHIHSFLQKQMIDYGIYIVEQAGKSRFNRAMLMNVGFTEAGKVYDNQCYIFHDVDLLPEDDRNLYSCPTQPRHMSAAVDTMMYKLPYPTIFGGVVAFKKEHFQHVNGFSNCFFGWGGEDDDLYNRLKNKGYRLKRYPLRIARYRMISHLKEYPSPDRFTYLNTGGDRYDVDGLNSLKYKLLNISKHKLYTTFTVDINEEEVMKDFQVTDMPPGLFVEDESMNYNSMDKGNKDEQTQSFYTIVKQSDIQKMVESLKRKAEERKFKKNVVFELPESGMSYV